MRILEDKLELPQKHLIPVKEHTESKKPKLTPSSGLTDDKLMERFGEGPPLRFELCNARLLYSTFVKKHWLNGSIQAAASCYSPDPLLKNAFSDIFNRKFDKPLPVDINGSQLLDGIRRCSLPVSSTSPFVQIAAKLYITTDKFLDFSKKPNGGSDMITIPGKDGSLTLFYLALKNAVDADLKVEFVAPSMETEVYGTLVAYFGNNFKYSEPSEFYSLTLFKNKRSACVGPGDINLMRSAVAVPAESSLIIKANLRDNASGNEILSGTCEMFVSLDGVPSVGNIVSKGYALNLTAKWKLPSEEQKIPSSLIYPPALASNSIVSRLTKRRKFGVRSTSSMADHSTASMADHPTLSIADHPTSSMADHPTSSMTDPDERNRWSLQEELEKVFNASLERIFNPREAVSCSISTCTKEDGADYLCPSVMHIWPELRKTRLHRGPKRAGLALKSMMDSEYKDMVESCVVCGPGFVKFKLSRKWIAQGIHRMLTVGIESWAPKLSVKKTVIYFLSQNRGEEMHTGHLRSTLVGETLARTLEYSGVVVIRKRINDEDTQNINLPDINHLDIKFKMMMEFLIESFPNGEDNDQAIELEVLYDKSKKRYEDAGFRERVTSVQGWDQSHQMAWSQICKIIRQCYQTVYQRLGVKVKEEDKRSYDTHIRDTLDLIMGKGLPRGSEGDKAVTEGTNSPLVYLAILRHALLEEKSDWILHVSDEGKRGSIEKSISGARLIELIGKDLSECPLSHVGFGLKHPEVVNFVNVLDEAKSRCKVLLEGQGMANQWTAEENEHAAEALGIGALKYTDLKNNRLTNYTFSVDQMFNEKGNTAVYLQFTLVRICSIIKKLKAEEIQELRLKNDDERELGLHLLRFTEVLEEVSTFLTPHILCEYVYGLCVKFDSLETSAHQVGGSSEETSKLLLCKATEVVMRKCFDLLGITPICKSDL
ncbi:arginyl-tRNA synthetase, class Ic [Artemisia annua]|uniref:arginine--tRNA ligase n=1 Tax=Artemisia annua TaxID=35608 RepID=A0A2U1NCV9_ARTAN|nr:arginyl-tRNA synthetase, class Ic [Artemisia annua]